MTAQSPDRIRLADRELPLYDLPLDQFFELAGLTSQFRSPLTSLWRGYVANWEVREHRLYLIDLMCHYPNGRTGDLRDLFPNFPHRVFAHWYCGDLRIPQGQRTGYVHGGFGEVYETILCIVVRSGHIVDRRAETMPPWGI